MAWWDRTTVWAVGLLCLTLLPGASAERGPAGERSPLPCDVPNRTAGAEPAVAPMSPDVAIELEMRPANHSALERLLAQLADPTSNGYRQFLTESGFERRFAPSSANLSGTLVALARAGARNVSVTPDRLGIAADLPAGSLNQFGAGRTEGCGSPMVPSTAIAPWVESVEELNRTPAHGPRSGLEFPGTVLARRAALPSQFVTLASSGSQVLFGSDAAQAYGASRLFPGGPGSTGTFGNGTAVATILTSGYNLTGSVDLPPFDPTALTEYYNETFPVSWPRPLVHGIPVTIAGTTPPLPGPNGSWSDDSLAQAENSLDLEMAGSMAPGASLYNFYIPASAYLGNSFLSDSGLADDLARALAAALSYNYSPARLATVSNSFGLPDLTDDLWDSELGHAAAIGVTVIASSGDQGDAPASLNGQASSPAPLWPSTAAFDSSGVLSVGGTDLTLTGNATASVAAGAPVPLGYDASDGRILSESAWYDTAGGAGSYVGSEGGISGTYGEPDWQYHSAAQPAIVNATLAAGDWSLGRAVPDLSLIGQAMVIASGVQGGELQSEIVDGTSISAPLVAGALAECAAVAGHPFGFVDPTLYRLESYYAITGAARGNPIRDVVNGSNYLYRAAAGWDAVTGWGSLAADLWPSAEANTTLIGFIYRGPTPGLPPPSLFGIPLYSVGDKDPEAVAIVGGALAVAIGVALYATLRAERSMVSAAPAGSKSAQVPPPPPERSACVRCRRSLAPWYATCPWCGKPR